MEKNNFQQWCNIQEPKLFRRSIAFRIFGWGGIIYYIWMIISIIISKFIFNSLKDDFLIFNYIPKYHCGWIIGAAMFILFTLLFLKLIKWFLPLSRVEYISCMLNKIANQLQFIKEESQTNDVVPLLEKLSNAVKFDRKYSSTDLFKYHLNSQNQFYDQLEDLPKRIFHAFKNKNLDKIETDKLKDLAYSILTDGEGKVQDLNSISSAYPETLNLRKIELMNKLKSYFETKMIKMTIWILILLINISFICVTCR